MFQLRTLAIAKSQSVLSFTVIVLLMELDVDQTVIAKIVQMLKAMKKENWLLMPYLIEIQMLLSQRFSRKKDFIPKDAIVKNQDVRKNTVNAIKVV
jgi:hypothetical protein